ncbi:hypothetical protein MHYP_G00337470 [Metynnis hypsauchen]
MFKNKFSCRPSKLALLLYHRSLRCRGSCELRAEKDTSMHPQNSVKRRFHFKRGHEEGGAESTICSLRRRALCSSTDTHSLLS